MASYEDLIVLLHSGVCNLSRARVRELAKRAKRENLFPGLSYCQIMDLIVKDFGFVSWNHFCVDYK